MNELLLAVAGGGKTQSIIDACAAPDGPDPGRTLAITYTTTGQQELSNRLRAAFTPARPPIVTGWFSFLLSHFVRPYLPRRFNSQRLMGFNFHGDPGRYAKGKARYFDSAGRAYRRHVAKLTMEVLESSGGGPVERLERLYTDIYIDEAQDFVGWDLELLDVLLHSRTSIHLVGDLRQSLVETNPQDAKNKQYRGLAMATWFREREANTLTIEHQAQTWRSNQSIATFADNIFGPEHGFPRTTSLQTSVTEHDGVFAVGPEDVDAYVRVYSPQCLRYSRSSAKGVELDFRNFGEVKGLTFSRVLIHPTDRITKFLTTDASLEGRSACAFYVGVTRAQHSVAIVLPTADAEAAGLKKWRAGTARPVST